MRDSDASVLAHGLLQRNADSDDAEALRAVDADKFAKEIDALEKFRIEAFEFAVEKGYDHPDYTDWVWPGVKTDKPGAVTATAATAGDNE